MNFLSKIFSKSAKNILADGGRIIDQISTSDEEKMKAKNDLSNIVFTALNEIQSAQKDIIMSETQGGKLQRSWRPLVMLAFAFIVVYSYFIQPAFFPKAISMADQLEPEFWQLLKLGLGGYVIGRSAEKIAGSVTKNIDLPFLRKKDRKNIYG
ncbi:holin family protein [Ancylomarina sp. DW003]|nr:3TM-type holin [Ancylomarina sp. DW003]MDE5422437.1 holin family protein [Ancylomarina sp. DW003]